MFIQRRDDGRSECYLPSSLDAMAELEPGMELPLGFVDRLRRVEEQLASSRAPVFAGAGAEDRNFKGRLDQEQKGVWFYVDATSNEPAHYESLANHNVQEYFG